MRILRWPGRAGAVAALGIVAAMSSTLPGASGGTETFPYGVAARATATEAMLWSRATAAGTYNFQVATDAAFGTIVTNDTVVTSETDDFTLKGTARSLAPSTTYYYRFYDEQGSLSDTGTFETLPAAGTKARMELAFTGDSDILFQNHSEPVAGDFEVLTRVLEDAPDLFVYLGDTIYSDSGSPPAMTLQEKWAKYQANRIDVTQALLAGVSTWAVWDDHEVINDFEGAQLAIDNPALLQAGSDAFNDYWPVDETQRYGKFDFGKKIDLIFLDERTFRTQNAQHSAGPCVDDDGDADLAPTMPEEDRAFLGLPPASPACIADVFDANRTMLGDVQKRWLKRTLRNSTAKWKLIVNEVPITQLFALPYDRWEGYHDERNEILNFIGRNDIRNVVFLTTDSHMHLGARVYVDVTKEGAKPVAYEMLTGPIQTNTFNQKISGALGIPNGGNILMNYLTEHGLLDEDCVQTDEYGYGTVQTTDPAASGLKLRWKSHTPGTRGGAPVDGCRPVTLP